MNSTSPSQLGRYEVQAVLGKGSMGIVYLARDPLIGRLVALKTFRPNAGTDEEDAQRFRTRFLREAQSAGILSHPNIVTVHDVVEGGEEQGDDETFIAMEYVQGTNLKEVLRYGKPLEMGEVVEIFGQMAEALDYAHGKGVVHRDIKPANVLLTPQRQVKITDFGIARFEASNLTHHGQLLGTPNYMSPEQVQGREVDHRTDLFSLSVVLYEMIARNKPFSGENLTAVTHRIVYDQHTPLDRYVGGLPEPLLQLVDRALAKDPDKRFQSAGAMASELERVVAVYEQQIALSETQSIDRAAVLDGTGTAPGDATTPLPGSSGLGESMEGAGGEAVLAAGASALPPPPPDAASHSSLEGSTGAASGTGTGGGAGSGVGPGTVPGADSTGGAGGAFRGFRRWLKPEPGFGAPDWPRLGLVMVVVILLVAGFGSLVLSWLGPEVSVSAEPSPEERLEIEYLAALREGLQANEAEEPVAAAAAFRRAEALKPEEPRARRLREAAERRAEMENLSEMERDRLALQASAAEEALTAGRYQEALSTAQVVLESSAEDQEEVRGAARRVMAQARSALARQERAAQAAATADREAEAEPSEADGVVGEEEGAAEDAVAEGPGSLRIELETEGEGRLVVWVEDVLVADVGYEHLERVGLFRRKKLYRGISRVPGIEVEAGERVVRYEVRPTDGPVQAGKVDVEFPSGDTRALLLSYTPGQSLSVVVE